MQQCPMQNWYNMTLKRFPLDLEEAKFHDSILCDLVVAAFY